MQQFSEFLTFVMIAVKLSFMFVMYCVLITADIHIVTMNAETVNALINITVF